MLATVILGLVIAFFFGLGLRTIYNNFFKGEAACCEAECGGCSGGSGCPHCAMKHKHV